VGVVTIVFVVCMVSARQLLETRDMPSASPGRRRSCPKE